MFASEFPHSDSSRGVVEEFLEEFLKEAPLTDAVKRRLPSDNSIAFYGLSTMCWRWPTASGAPSRRREPGGRDGKSRQARSQLRNMRFCRYEMPPL